MAATRDVSARSATGSPGGRSRPKGASTITQQLARGLFPEAVGFQIGDVSLERKIKEAHRRDPDREALHQARDLHALRQPDVPRRRRVRRRGRVAALFRQVREGSDARRGGARSPASSRATWRRARREHGRAKRRRQLRARADGGGGLHHRRRKRRTPRRGRSSLAPTAEPCQSDRAVLPRRGPQGARGPLRREAAVRERSRRSRPRSTCGCRKRPTRRSTTACGGSTSAAASASRAATSSPRATRSRHSRSRAGIGRWRRRRRPGGRDRTSTATAMQLRAGALRVTVDRKGYRLDGQDVAGPARDARRSRRDAAADHRGDRHARPPARSSRRRPSKARCSRSTTAPARSGDGRRLQLRAQQVQPRDPGVPAGRLGVQADRLHRGDRPRLHAGHDPDGHAGQLSRRRRPAAVRAAELRPQVRGPDHAAARARAVAQRAGGAGDGAARARSR